MTISRENIIFELDGRTPKFRSFNAQGEEYTYPTVFKDRKKKGYQSEQGLVYAAPTEVEAAIVWAQQVALSRGDTLPDDYLPHLHFACGTRNVAQGVELIYVEYVSKNDPDRIKLVEYNPATGRLRMAVKKLSSQTFEKRGYTVEYNSHSNATPIWLAILSYFHMEQVGDLVDVLNEVKCGKASADEAFDSLAESLFNIEEYIKSNLELELEDDGKVAQIPVVDIKSDYVGPQDGKMLAGECAVFLCGKKLEVAAAESAGIEPTRYENLRKLLKRQTYTDTEKMTILPIDNKYVEDGIDEYILRSCERTWVKDTARQDKNIFLAGDPGIGKSAKTRRFASMMGMPYRTHIFSAETSVDELFEMIIPRIDDNEAAFSALSSEEQEIFKVLVASEEIDYSKIAEILKLPTLDEIYFDPAAAYETITGIEKADASEFEARTAFDQKVSSKINAVYGKAKENESSSNGQMRFKRVLTPITEAIKNGYVLELQEVSSVLRPGVLTKLHDVLERASAGVLNLGCGDIVRHPDFICFVTTNIDDVGCQEIATPFLDRFPIKRKLPRLTTEMMISRVMAFTETKDEKLAREIVEAFETANTTGEVNGAERRAAMRSLLSFADAVVDGENPLDEFEARVLNELTWDDEIAQTILAEVEECDLFRR